MLLVVSPAYAPYSPPGRTLLRAFSEVGLRESDVKQVPPHAAVAAIRSLRPHAVFAVGEHAASVCIPGFAGDVQRRRGYLHEGVDGVKVIPTVDAALAHDSWVPWYTLFATDLKRAREQSASRALTRPKRDVIVIDSRAAADRAVRELSRARRIACDIEIHDAATLACVGFADSPERAFVFPSGFSEGIRALLGGRVPLAFQNGQFDLHFLLTRCGIRVTAPIDDTLVAWHACYPELAGASTDSTGAKKGAKRTHKSLAFFASIFTLDAWWKDYGFANLHEMYVLNGRDCCITFEVMEKLDALIDSQGVRAIYEHTCSLIWPVVEMQSRGLVIDEQLRQERMQAIDARIDDYERTLSAIALPLIEAAAPTLAPDVRARFEHTRRCGCCGGGSVARAACHKCAGFAKKPGKRQLAASGLTLEPCRVCEGAGKTAWFEFNSASVEQKRALFYEVLRLPKRYVTKRSKTGAKTSVLSTDEDTLRQLLANL